MAASTENPSRLKTPAGVKARYRGTTTGAVRPGHKSILTMAGKREKADTDKRTPTCSVCGKQCSSEFALQGHMKSHKSE